MKPITQLLLHLSYLLPLHSAQAVTLVTPVGGDIANHEIAPVSGAPWDNVLDVNGNSGVYLGGGWVLTARHVFASGAATVTYDGAAYHSDSSYILNIKGASNNDTDLRLFRLENSIITLSSLSLGNISIGDPVTMIGRGGDPRTKRWGTNHVEKTGIEERVAGRKTKLFSTDYDTATIGEAQAIGGDSGGGVFYQDGSEWKIAGTIVSVDRSTSPQLTKSVHLSAYETQINDYILLHGDAPVPEPSTLLLLGIAGCNILLRRKRS